MTVRVLQGDVLDRLRGLGDESVHCVITSPPYWGLRDYDAEGQIGLEPTLQEHIERLVAVFREVRRVLRRDGTCWLNYGDAYNAGTAGARKPTQTGKHGYWENPNITRRTDARPSGLKTKDRMLLPARVAIALQDDGWWVRDEIIWHKPNPMPVSVRDRTTPAHEMIYLLTRSAKYFYDQEAIKEPAAVATWNDGSRVYGGVNKAGANARHGERTTGRRTGKVKVPGGWDKGDGAHGTIHRDGRTEATYVEAAVSETRNKRSVWTVAPAPFPEAHFATFPPKLIEPCVLAGAPERCCPHCGKGWKREVVTFFKPQAGVDPAKGVRGAGDQKPLDASNGWQGYPRGVTGVETVGWGQACECPAAEPVRGTVLDPFFGSGTTAVVCIDHGRDCIGIEINPAYVEIARRRIAAAELRAIEEMCA